MLGLTGITGGNIVNNRDWDAAYHKGLAEVGENHGGIEFTADPRVNPKCNESGRSYVTRPRLLREIADLDVPTVFINGGRDIRPNWPTQQLAALLPQGEYVAIAEAAHHIWLTHADRLRAEIRKAVRRILGTNPVNAR